MRTWVIFSALIICETIDPGREYSIILGVFAIILLIVGIAMDAIELINKL